MGRNSRRIMMALRDPEDYKPAKPKTDPQSKRALVFRTLYRVLARKTPDAKRSAAIFETLNQQAALDLIKSLKDAGVSTKLSRGVQSFEEVGTESKDVKKLRLPKRTKQTKPKDR